MPTEVELHDERRDQPYRLGVFRDATGSGSYRHIGIKIFPAAVRLATGSDRVGWELAAIDGRPGGAN